MQKSKCTPEQWQAYLAYHRDRWAKNREAVRAKKREYNSRPEVKARRQAFDARTEVVERKQALQQSEEYKARDRERRKARREMFPEVARDRADRLRKARTGFGPALVQQLLEKQGNACALCGAAFASKFHADHCHDSGVPRGLLCHSCNIVEGLIRRSGLSPQEFAGRLASYLANPPAAAVTPPSLPC